MVEAAWHESAGESDGSRGSVIHTDPPVTHGMYVIEGKVIPFQELDSLPVEVGVIGGKEGLIVAGRLPNNGPEDAQPPTKVQAMTKHLQEIGVIRGKPQGPGEQMGLWGIAKVKKGNRLQRLS
jgi:hypothetical protein